MEFKKIYVWTIIILSPVMVIAGIVVLLLGMLGEVYKGLSSFLILTGLVYGLGFFFGHNYLIEGEVGEGWGWGCLSLFCYPVMLPALPLAVLAWPLASWVTKRYEEKERLEQAIEKQKAEIIAMIDEVLEETEENER